jgi:hypothetical protein
VIVYGLNQMMWGPQLPQGGRAVGTIQDHVPALASQRAVDRGGDGRVLEESVDLDPFYQRLNPSDLNFLVQDERVGR